MKIFASALGIPAQKKPQGMFCVIARPLEAVAIYLSFRELKKDLF